MRFSRSWGLAVLAGAWGALAAAPAGAAVASAAHGRSVALRSCAGCHAVDPTADHLPSRAPPFWAIAGRRDEPTLRARLATISRRGHIEMPPIYMTPREIRDIAAYIHTVPKPARRHAPIVAREAIAAL